MRVRITKALKGSVDGMQLSRLLNGHVYDLYTSLACYLLSEEVAEPAIEDAPEGIVPEERRLLERAPWTRRTVSVARSIILPPSVAADRSRKRKPKKT
jgi:hypothetical protein